MHVWFRLRTVLKWFTDSFSLSVTDEAILSWETFTHIRYYSWCKVISTSSVFNLCIIYNGIFDSRMQVVYYYLTIISYFLFPMMIAVMIMIMICLSDFLFELSFPKFRKRWSKPGNDAINKNNFYLVKIRNENNFFPFFILLS